MTLTPRLAGLACAVILFGYAAWIFQAANRQIATPRSPLDPGLAWMTVYLQAVPSLLVGALAAVNAVVPGRHRWLSLLTDIAVLVMAWVVLAFGAVLAMVELEIAWPVLAVGGIVIATVALGRLLAIRRR